MKKIVLLLLICITACCSQKKEEPVYKDGSSIEITGIITVIGNEPFTKLAIRPDDGSELIQLPSDFRKNRKEVINKKLTLSGKVSVKKMTSASGRYNRFEYKLVDPVIKE